MGTATEVVVSAWDFGGAGGDLVADCMVSYSPAVADLSPVRDGAPATSSELSGRPPWRRVETSVLDTGRLIRAAYDHRFAVLGLNLTSASIVAYVRDFGPVTQTNIAAHLRMGKAATGSAIDKLVERGVLERQSDPNDRRVWRIALTADGERFASAAVDLDGQLGAELRRDMTREERQLLYRMLSKLQANAQYALGELSEIDRATRCAVLSEDPTIEGADTGSSGNTPRQKAAS